VADQNQIHRNIAFIAFADMRGRLAFSTFRPRNAARPSLYYCRMETVDVLVIGGGLVGSSLAIALDNSAWRVALAEAAAPAINTQPSQDERNLALARASVNALEALDVWPSISPRATPIRKIHISRQGEFGAVRLDAAKHDVDFFGAVIPARELGNGLLDRIDRCASLIRLAPATLKSIARSDDGIVAQFSTPKGDKEIRTRLLVGADGTASFVRSALGIETARFDYEQTAFAATITVERKIDSAYERFTATGPTAMLPLGDHRAGVVLTVPSADASRVANFDDAAFVACLHERFGWRLGKLSKPGRRMPYPLKRVQAQRLIAPRAVLIGNAAQTLHPIAAQGFNLGLRDALTLAELLRDAGDPGAISLLSDYAECRRADRDGTIAMSDGLARWTGNDSPPLKVLRSLGMLALDRIEPLQSALVSRSMGFRGVVPNLALRRTR
jgi:2-octaprenyl-6-methoxyphenol hydroxylase